MTTSKRLETVSSDGEGGSKTYSFDDMQDIGTNQDIATMSMKQYLEREIEHLKEERKANGLPDLEIKAVGVSVFLAFHDQENADRTQIGHKIETRVSGDLNETILLQLFDDPSDNDSPGQRTPPKEYEGVAYQ
jgi:hypothetical protein